MVPTAECENSPAWSVGVGHGVGRTGGTGLLEAGGTGVAEGQHSTAAVKSQLQIISVLPALI